MARRVRRRVCYKRSLQFIFYNTSSTGDISVFVKNSEWVVENIPAQRNVFYYSCCAEPYPDVTFSIVLDRRPAFYLMTMLFPCILVSCVAALVFLLPVESGEKVSLEITVLLSLAVFLLLVSETLPPASDNFPIIGRYTPCCCPWPCSCCWCPRPCRLHPTTSLL